MNEEKSNLRGTEEPALTPCESDNATDASAGKEQPKEIGGRQGPEPTRYGDWEKNGRCIDF